MSLLERVSAVEAELKSAQARTADEVEQFRVAMLGRNGTVTTLFEEFKGKAPGINGWALDKQNFEWVVPYHPGAVRYFKEIGKWTDKAEAHNAKLIERQKVLKAAWAEMTKKSISDEKAYSEAWLKLRAEKLTAAGFDPIYK